MRHPHAEDRMGGWLARQAVPCYTKRRSEFWWGGNELNWEGRAQREPGNSCQQENTEDVLQGKPPELPEVLKHPEKSLTAKHHIKLHFPVAAELLHHPVQGNGSAWPQCQL